MKSQIIDPKIAGDLSDDIRDVFAKYRAGAFTDDEALECLTLLVVCAAVLLRVQIEDPDVVFEEIYPRASAFTKDAFVAADDLDGFIDGVIERLPIVSAKLASA